MDIKAEFSEKVSKLIFLEFRKESIPQIFKITAEENIYLPVRPIRVVDKVKKGEKFEKIPVSFFIEGMFYVIGGDPDFKYNKIYDKILKANCTEAVNYVKGIIFDEVKSKSYEDAYILLKGLISIEENAENYDKLFIVLEKLISIDSDYKTEYTKMLDKSEKLKDYNVSYYKKALFYYDEKKYEDSWYNLNTYIEKTGDRSKDVIQLKHVLTNIRSYEKGKNLLHRDPNSALNYLLPLTDEFGDDPILYYNIAVAYRILKSYDKAIYFLNEAMAIDSNYADIVNELGINYAALGDYDTAIKYLRKAFEVTKSLEICTNLIMCYLNIGDKKEAKMHYDIAKKINPKDEILVKIGKMLEK
ncbi:MAG: tetratricopeptide repeat protein [Clostridium sp.]|nr:tetratricopeptide repeat protein [Clostridium sp.]